MTNIRLPLTASKSFVYVWLGLGLALIAGGAWLFSEHHALAQLTTRFETQLAASDAAPVADGSGCLSTTAVDETLSRLGELSASLDRVAFVPSWLLGGEKQRAVALVSEKVLPKRVFAAMACQLQLRERAIWAIQLTTDGPADPEAMGKQLRVNTQALVALEEAVANLQRAANHADSPAVRLRALYQAAQYLWSRPVLGKAVSSQRLLLQALDERVVPLPARAGQTRQQASAWISKAIPQYVAALQTEAAKGAPLLQSVAAMGSTAPVDAQHVTDWLTGVERDWLQDAKNTNPCARLDGELRPLLQALVQVHGYPSALANSLDSLGPAQCVEPVLARLRGMQLAPQGALFDSTAQGLAFTPWVNEELQGLRALWVQPFVSAAHAGQSVSFACNPAASSWQPANLAQAQRYVKAYQAFTASPTLAPPVGAKFPLPLYLRLAKWHVEAAMNASLKAAQMPVGDQSLSLVPSLNKSIVMPERALAQHSAEFAQSTEDWLSLLASYQQIGLAKSYQAVAHCVSSRAVGALQQVSSLAEQSRLYTPRFVASDPDSLGFDWPSAILQDHLERNRARVQVLAGYAMPYVHWLNHTDQQTRTSDLRAASLVSYWSNTLNELNTYLQATGEAIQLNALEETLLQTDAPGLTFSNCHQKLADMKQPPFDNDLFSERRQSLMSMLSWRCDDRQSAVALEEYQALAARFNSELAGRYPFAGLDARDANPETVRAFFADYAVQREVLREKLSSRQGDKWRAALSFVAQLNAVADFLRGGQLVGSSVLVNVQAQPLRNSPQKNLMPGHNQLVSWALSTSSSQIVAPSGATTQLYWAVGQALTFNLTWADRSLWRPEGEANTEGMQTEGVAANFDFNGPWAMLRLLEQWAARPSSGAQGPSAKAWPIEFRVPVRRATPTNESTQQGVATLSFDVTLSTTDPVTGAAQSLGGPVIFPRSAPQSW
ncbi:hypothetical protein [Parvibium lacunae]|uniref:IcmF-related N-terminal domain-containing protein n=1 Tax=Parvibium lacunae TaxID=1888893 RepID=A0A368L7N8_9BURK|nr:hypothetical protein [Parvibium lacunae]RCS59521.1 hypothetical protein DU000_01990 [Parvibium lacunae]